MKTNHTQYLVLVSILTAVSVVLGYIHVPTLTGFITLLDVGIFFTAFSLGSRAGMIVGSLSGLILDLLLGYPQWALFSMLFHGLQGYAAGWSGKRRLLGLIVASCVMVGGYFLASVLLYNLASALDSLVGNLIQNAIGIVLGSILTRGMANIRKVEP